MIYFAKQTVITNTFWTEPVVSRLWKSYIPLYYVWLSYKIMNWRDRIHIRWVQTYDTWEGKGPSNFHAFYCSILTYQDYYYSYHQSNYIGLQPEISEHFNLWRININDSLLNLLFRTPTIRTAILSFLYHTRLTKSDLFVKDTRFLSDTWNLCIFLQTA